MQVISYRKKQFLTQTYSYLHEQRGKLARAKALKIIDYLCFDWLQIATKGSEDLRNVKGRNQRDTTLSFSQVPKGEEILWMKGKLLFGPEPKDKGDAKSFELSITSPFKAFKGRREIVHSVEHSRSPTLPNWFEPFYLGSALPVEIEEFRFGLEYFTPVFGLFSLGYTPTVTQSFVLDYRGEELFLRIEASRLPQKETIPFEPHLSEVLSVLQP